MKTPHTLNKQLFLLLTLSFTLISSIVLSSRIVSADDSIVDEINITVPTSCSMSGTGMTSHNAEINNGQYNSAIGETTIKAFCNDNNGFAIYAIGYTDNEEGKNVLTNSTLGSTYDIETGTAITGNDSQWAMKLATISSPTPTYPIIIAGSTNDTEKEQGDPDFTTFQEVPDDYEKVAYRTAATDTGTNAEGATLTTTFQAYISKTQPAGTYTGQVKYTLVHPHDAAAPTPPTTINDIDFMQDFNTLSSEQIVSLRNSMTEGVQYQLTDSRDDKTYYVAKLKDGNIWMTQNLDFDIDSSETYTSENTDLYSEETWTPNNSTLLTCEGAEPFNGPKSCDSGNYYWNGEFGDGFSNTESMGNPHYHVGNKYNWFAANIASGEYAISHGTICPAGWTIPDYSNYDVFLASYQYERNQLFSSPVFLTSGAFNTTEYWSREEDDNGDYIGYYRLFISNQSPEVASTFGSILINVRCIAN